MKTFIVTVVLSMWTLSADASEKWECGVYEVRGWVRNLDGENILKLYEGSMSETILTLSPELEKKTANFVDVPVVLTAQVSQAVEKYRGHLEATSDSKVEFKELDPLRPKVNSGYKLLKAQPCKATKK